LSLSLSSIVVTEWIGGRKDFGKNQSAGSQLAKPDARADPRQISEQSDIEMVGEVEHRSGVTEPVDRTRSGFLIIGADHWSKTRTFANFPD
jgi:hypothetical protein